MGKFSRKEQTEEIKTRDDLISSGSTLLNLACSDNPFGAFHKGKLVNIIGDSSAGKTFLALTTLAEACYNKQFKNYDLVYDEPEQADEFDLEYLFGKKFVNRLEIPLHSKTIQDFQRNIRKRLAAKKPCIYVLDSFDALTSDQELKGPAEGKGSYKTEKAKMASEILRMTVSDMKNTGSYLIIVSQTREAIGVMFGSKKTRSGGKALKFYSTHEMWLAVVKRFTKTTKKRVIGVKVRIKISKNKLTGKERVIEIPIYYDYGFDNIGANIDFLIDEKYWLPEKTKKDEGDNEEDSEEKKSRKINTKGFCSELITKSLLIKWVEENNKEKELALIVAKAWHKIEDSLKLNRKNKYE